MNVKFHRGIDPKQSLILGRSDLLITINSSGFSDSFMRDGAWDIRDYLLKLDKDLKFNSIIKKGENHLYYNRSMYIIININAKYPPEDIINRLIELKPNKNKTFSFEFYGNIFEYFWKYIQE